MANKRKILENARKLAQKGAKEKALKEYQKLLNLDPADAKLRLEIGDAHRRWGQIEEAIATYDAVASQYAKEGFDARAVAVYKQIVTLDSEHLAAYEPLAELYERMGLIGEALGALQTAADAQNRNGDKNRALDLLRKMATMDPTNTTSRMKVAELLRQESREAESIAEYEETARELERQGDLEGSGRAYVAVLEMSPDHLEATKGVTRSMMAQNAPDKAVACARRVVKLGPDDVENYELLAETLRANGQEDELSAVYRGMAEVYRQRGDEDRAREITQRYVSPDALAMEAEIGDPAPVSVLEDAIENPFGDELLEGEVALDDDFLEGEGALDDEEFLGDELIEDDEAISAVELEAPLVVETPLAVETIAPPSSPSPLITKKPAAPTPVAPTPAAAPAAEIPADADPDQLLAEASVYLRYGKQDRAILHLEAVLQHNPHHRGALEKLGEACVELGDDDRAVEAWMTAARCAQQEGDFGAFDLLRARIGGIDVDAAESLAPPAAPAAPEQDVGEIEIDFDLDGIDDAESESPDELSLSKAPQRPAAGATTGGSLSSTTSQQISDDLEEADFYVQQNLLDEAEAIYKRVLAVAPSHPTALVRLGELAASRGQDPNSTGSAELPQPQAIGSAHEDLVPPSAPEVAAAGMELEIDIGEDPFASDAFESVASEETVEFDEPEFETTEPESAFELPGEELVVPPALADEEALGFEFDPDEELDLSDSTPVSPPAPAVDRELVFEPEPTPMAPPAPASPAPVPPAPAPPSPVAPPPPPPPAVVESPPVFAVSEAPGLETAQGGVDLVAEIGGFEDGPEMLTPDDSFDLAAEISDALGESVSGMSGSGSVDDGFSAVFSAFKKGVSETLGAGDHQAHYDLGIAYKEMGLFDDALAEFRAAMLDENRRPECLHLMALCALDGGVPETAVAHLSELLACPELNAEAALAAQYDIGRAYAALGDIGKARLAYQSVRALDPSFRDVAELEAALNAPTPEASSVPNDDGQLEGFEDFLNDEDDEEDELAATLSDEIGRNTESEYTPVMPTPRLDASALAEAAAESDLEAPIVMADAFDEDFDDDEGAAEPEVAVVENEPAETTGSTRRRKKKISFV